MYAVATYALAAEFRLGLLATLPTTFALIALAAWLATFAGSTVCGVGRVDVDLSDDSTPTSCLRCSAAGCYNEG